MDAFSSPSAANSSQFSADDFKDQLKNQLAQAYAEEFLEMDRREKIKRYQWCIYGQAMSLSKASRTMRGKCFDKCITKPGSSLSGSEGSCVSRCMERYIEATGIISRAILRAPQ